MSYAAEILADSPIAYWRMGESSGPTVASQVNSPATDGTAINSPTFGVAGALSGDADTAISFTTAQRVDCSNALFQVGDVLSVEAWIKRSSTGVSERAVVSQGVNALFIGIKDTSDLVTVAKNGVAYIADSTVAITDTTTWHHIAYTKNGSTNALYVDGVNVTNLIGNQTLSSDTSLTIAAKVGGGSEDAGAIDEVAWYGSALSAGRVLAHYNAGLGIFPATFLPSQPHLRW